MGKSEPLNVISQLTDRALCYDGDSIFLHEDVERLCHIYDIRYVDEITPDIERYNRFADVPLRCKEEVTVPKLDWNIPARYSNLDVMEFVLNQIDDPTEEKVQRVMTEMEMFEQQNLINMLRTLIYVISTLNEHNCVWGVGRGSCTASYVLYLIGVHDIDCIKYGLDIYDFLGHS